MKNFKKATASLLTFSLMMGVVGCDSIPFIGGGKANNAVEETITSYMENITNGKIDKATKLVAEADDDDEEELSFSARYDEVSDLSDLVDAFLATTEFDISNIEADTKKEEGSAKVKISVADLDAIAEDLDEDADIDDIIEAIEDCDDKIDEKIKVSLILDGDEWLIDSGSDVDIADFYFEAMETDMTIGGDIDDDIDIDIDDDFDSDFNEESVEKYIDNIFTQMASGDFEQYLDEGESLGDMFNIESSDNADVNTSISNFFKTYFSNITYTTTINSIDESAKKADVTISTNVPCANELINAFARDVDVMKVVMAYELFDETFDFDNLSPEMNVLMFNGLTSVISSVGKEQLSANCTVYIDANGDWKIDNLGDCIFGEVGDVEYTDEETYTLVLAALQYALDEGMITEDMYNAYVEEINNEINGTTGTSSGEVDEYGYPVADNEGEGFNYYIGDELFDIEITDNDGNSVSSYSVGDSVIKIHVETWSSYDEDTMLTFFVYGPDIDENNNVFIAEKDPDWSDEFYMTIIPEGGLKEGTYTFCLVDPTATDGDSAIITVVTIDVK